MITHDNMESNIVHHCNNRCASCNHLSTFAPQYFMEPASLERDLKLLSKLMQIGYFCLQGGEPLLHPQLLLLMDIVAASGITKKPGILSNGKLFPAMSDEFWIKCAEKKFELRCTIYPNLPVETIELAKSKAAQFGVDYRPWPLNAFYFMLKDYPNGESYVGCPWRECWAVHDGYFFACPIAPFMA